jgi:hypothetical protein
MEWMLQVVDEFDDAVGAVRHHAMGFSADIGRTLAAAAGAAVVVAAALNGAGAMVIAAAVGLLGTAALLKMQGLLRV